MTMPRWMNFIPDGALFEWRDKPGACANRYSLHWKETSPEKWDVKYYGGTICNTWYSWKSLLHSMKAGSTINGMTLEQWEAYVPSVPDDDIDFEISIL